MKEQTITEKSWIDLPEDDYIAMLGYSSSNAKILNQLARTYHLIPKVEIKQLGERVTALEGIAEFILNWLDNQLTGVEKKKHLRMLAKIAIEKRNYLASLQGIYDHGQTEQDWLEAYHRNLDGLYDSNKKYLTLTHRHFFSLIQCQYWGDFWMESIDPCHRQLTHYYRVWARLTENKRQQQPFFMWLEDQYVPPYVLRAEYLTKDQLKPHKISIIDGKLYQQEQLAQFNDDGDKYLFTVNLDGNLYIIKETETIFHTSLTNGRPVLSAGKIKVENGSIVDVYFESGHYIPSVPIGYQLFSVLKEKSYRFVKTRISFFHDRNKYSAELMPNELSHYDSFYQKLCQTSPMACRN